MRVVDLGPLLSVVVEDQRLAAREVVRLADGPDVVVVDRGDAEELVRPLVGAGRLRVGVGVNTLTEPGAIECSWTGQARSMLALSNV